MKTINQFCEIFNISRPTFYDWERKGIVKPMRIGGVTRISDDEIERIKGIKRGE